MSDDGLRNYTRWRRQGRSVVADILGAKLHIVAKSDERVVLVKPTGNGGMERLTPDEARLYGVRLIDAATLADGDRIIREDARASDA